MELALRTQGKTEEAATTEKLFKTAWRYADTQPPTVERASVATH
jgi:hypothetical protein